MPDNNSLQKSPTLPVSRDKNKIVKQLTAIVIAGLLVWLSFKGANFSQVLHYAATASPIYLSLMCFSALCSHLVRAWRWVILLRPLKEQPVSLWHSFCAVMYGYAINIVVPRGGEIVRLVSICKLESLPWAGVLPTLLIDRLLDLVMLALLLGCTLIGLPAEIKESMPWLYPTGIFLTIGTLSVLLILPKLASILSFLISIPAIKKLIPLKIMDKVHELLEQFALGTKTLTNPLSYPLIALSTALIWCFYWLNFYFVMCAFGLDNLLTVSKGLILFTIGSLGSLVPTPGCVGGFHFMVSKCLVLTCHIDQNLALAFATVLHAFAFVITICLAAFICFVWQNLSNNRKSD